MLLQLLKLLLELGLPNKGKESIFPCTTARSASVSLVLFSIVTVHSPMIGMSSLSAFNFFLDSSSISGLLCL